MNNKILILVLASASFLYSCSMTKNESIACSIDSVSITAIPYMTQTAIPYRAETILAHFNVKRNTIFNKIDKKSFCDIWNKTYRCVDVDYLVDVRLVCLLYNNGNADTLSFGGRFMQFNSKVCDLDTSALLRSSAYLPEDYMSSVREFIDSIWGI